MKIRLIVSGRHYDAAAAVPSELSLSDGASLDEALAHIEALLPEKRLPESCLIAVNGAHLGTVGKHATEALRDRDELLLLLPVAGG